jgi:2-amino-4-hydroxy-6-hydroxymethyldihydropteridine diphosphokinase
VYLSLGSNLGDRAENVRAALRSLAARVEIEAVSSLYETAPVGVPDQPAFLNAVARGSTALAPHELLAFLKGIEQQVGRRPTFRWGPRVIDIDILLYDGTTLDSPTLTIPHREMMRRAFVLVPLAEIAPDLTPPGQERTIEDLARTVRGRDGVTLIGSV